MAEYLVQMENGIQASQIALKNELQAAQIALKTELQAAQVKSEERMHAHNQALAALTYKVLFLGCGVALGGFALIEGIVKALGYEFIAKKKLIET